MERTKTTWSVPVIIATRMAILCAAGAVTTLVVGNELPAGRVAQACSN